MPKKRDLTDAERVLARRYLDAKPRRKAVEDELTAIRSGETRDLLRDDIADAKAISAAIRKFVYRDEAPRADEDLLKKLLAVLQDYMDPADWKKATRPAITRRDGTRHTSLIRDMARLAYGLSSRDQDKGLGVRRRWFRDNGTGTDRQFDAERAKAGLVYHHEHWLADTDRQAVFAGSWIGLVEVPELAGLKPEDVLACLAQQSGTTS